MQPQANIPLSTGPGGDSLKRLISEIEHEVNMSKSHILTLVLLILAAMAWALPQGTITWTFEEPGSNNSHFYPGWTWDTANMQTGQYPDKLDNQGNLLSHRYHSQTWSGYFVNRVGYIQTGQLYFVAGETLNFSAWLYNAGVGTVDVKIYASTSPTGPWTSATLFYNAQNVNVNSGWTPVGSTYTAIATGNYYIRYAVVCNSGNADGYIDDITVTYNLGAALNVNSTGPGQPGTAIFKDGQPTGYNTPYTFTSTPTTVSSLAGVYTPGPAPAGYHWKNPSITVLATDFTIANNYVYDITFELEKDFTLIVQSTGYNQPGTTILKDNVSTDQVTDHTFTAISAAALAGTYTPGTAPDGYHWTTGSITVSTTDFTAVNNYTHTITFVLEEDAPLPVELSSFTAMLSVDNFVNLLWVTQSESGVLGYYVYRGQSDVLAEALQVSPLIAATNTSQQQSYLYTDRDTGLQGSYYYWLQSVDLDGLAEYFGPVTATVNGAGSTVPPIPAANGLAPAYPNPFSQTAWIGYSLAAKTQVEISVFNARGQRVRHLASLEANGGQHQLTWDGRDDQGRTCDNGLYLIRLTAGNEVFTRKLLMMN